MDVLVVGGTGFIGRSVASHLNKMGHQVTITGTAKPTASHTSGFARYRQYVLESDNPESLELDQYDSAVVLPWISRPDNYLESDENKTFKTHTLNLVDSMFVNGVDNVAVVGSCLEYAKSRHSLVEDSPLETTSSRYAEAKIALHEALIQSSQSRSSNLLWLRPFFPYGPGEAPRKLVTATIKALMDSTRPKYLDVSAYRDFIFVDDVGSAIAHLLARRSSGPFNIGTGNATRVSEMVRLIHQGLGLTYDEIQYTNSDEQIIANTNKLFSTGWTPKFTVEEGIERTIAALKRDG